MPFVSLSHKRIKKILELANLNQARLLYDLGCGDARFLVAAVKKYPKLKAVGIEINLWAYLRAQANISLSQVRSQVKIYYKNFYKINLSQADIIYCYLWPGAMERLKPKLEHELKSGAVVMSYAFPIKNWIKPEIKEIQKGKLYVYNLN